MSRRLPKSLTTWTVRCCALLVSLTALSSCALQEEVSTQRGSDLGWLWGLIGVVALFVLGGIVYKMRNPRRRPDPNAPHAPEGRIVVKRGGKKFKQSGPYDYGPRVPDDPSSVPKFYHHGPGF